MLFQSAFKIYTRGVYNFSDVYNSGTSGTDADNNLVIDYEAFVVSVDDVTDGATHWVSAGIEYNNSFNVWIGQVSYTMKTSNPVSSYNVWIGQKAYTMKTSNPISSYNIWIG